MNTFNKILHISCWVILGCFYSGLLAQCPGPGVSCNGSYSNVVISEVSGDAGQSDGCNDGIVEIAGPPGTDIGCMVLSNSEWAVVLPTGSTIPADGVFLIACSSDPNANCGVGINGTSNGLIADGTEGDFTPGFQAEIDFDVCDVANANYYAPAATGFTIDNSGASDGDQVALFQPDGTVHDAVAWGGPGAIGNSDNCAVQNGPYTLGDNDGNGIVNDNLASLVGGRCDGNNASGVSWMPPGNCGADMVCYTMPQITDPVYVIPASPTFSGCNSSYIRLDPGTSQGGVNGSPSHADGSYTDQPVDANGNPTGVGTTTMENFTPGGYNPSACTPSPAEWSYTDHPNPGQANDIPAFAFYVDNSVLCAPGDVTFTVEVYNYQRVSDDTDILSGVDNAQLGSLVDDPIAGGQQTWQSYAIAGATTSMTYTQTVTTPGTYTFELVWDDFSNCCGSSSSFGNECYESIEMTVELVEPLVLTDAVIDCDAGDANAGTLNAADFITGGANNMYELVLDGVSQGPASPTSTFSLGTGAATTSIQINVTDGSGCSSSVSMMVDLNCLAPPVCPSALDNTGTTADGPFCPGSTVDLCLNGTDLPAGGTICWYGAETDPIDNATGIPIGSANQIGCVAIPAGSTPSGSPVINEVAYDTANNDGSGGEWIEIAGAPGTNVGCFIVTDGDWVVVLPPGTTIPADGFLVIANAATVDGNPADVDVDVDTCGCISGGPNMVMTNGGEFVNLFDDMGAFLDGVDWEVPSSGNSPGGSETVPSVAGCTSPASVTTQFDETIGNGGSNESISRDPDETGSWVFSSNSGAGLDFTMGATNAGSAAPPCLSYTFQDADCGTLLIEPLIAPIDPNCTGADFNYVGPSSEFMIDCPEAVIITSSIDACDTEQITADLIVNISGGTGPYTLVYTEDGGATNNTANGFMSGDPIIIPAPTNGEIKVSLVSVTDEMGAMCTGTVGSEEVCVNLRPTETVTITSSTDPSSCDPCDGSITFDFSPSVPISPGNTYDIDYTFNGATFSLGSVSLPYTLNSACPGVYDITLAADDFGCAAIVTTNEQTLSQPAGTPLTVVQPAAVCGDGSVDIDLTDDALVDLTPNYTSTDFTFYSVDPASVPSAALPTAQLSSTTVSGIAMTTSVWAVYTDMNGCESSVEIVLDASAACPSCAITMGTVTPSACSDAGTPGDPTDDTFSFTIDLTQGDPTFTDFTFDGSALGLTTTETGTYSSQYSSGNLVIGALAGTTVTLTIVDNTAPTPDTMCTIDVDVVIPATCSNYVCPIIAGVAAPASICAGDTFDIAANGLANMAMMVNTEVDFGIDFVTFGAGSTFVGTDPYSGGTSMATVASNALTGTDPNQIASATGLGAALPAGVHQVCAILDPTPTGDMTCRPFACLTVEVFPQPVFTATTNSPVCPGDDIVLTANTPTVGSAPFTWNWSFGGASIATSQVHTVTSATATDAGTYTVTLTDTNGCTTSTTVDVVVEFQPSISLDPVDPFCENEPLDITTLPWETNPPIGTLSYHSTQADADANLNPLMSTLIAQTQDVYARYTSAEGCYITFVLSLTVNPSPVFDIPDQLICPGPIVDLPIVPFQTDLTAFEPASCTGGQWTDPTGFPIPNPGAWGASPGIHTYSCTDANGCTGTDTMFLDFLPNNDIAIADQVICDDVTSVDLTLLEPTGQTGGSWTTNGIAGPAVPSPTMADPTIGPFTYTHTDVNGCDESDSFQYTFDPSPTLNIVNPSPICIGENLDVSVVVFGEMPTGGSFSFHSSQADADTNSAPLLGTIISMTQDVYVRYELATGCFTTGIVSVVVNPLPVLVLEDQEICGDVSTVDLSALEPVGQTGGTWSSASGAAIASPTSVDPTTGPFTYTYADANNCSNSATVNYNILSEIQIVAQASCLNSNDLNEYYIDVISVTGGDPNNQYNVTIASEPTQVFNGTPLSFGPFTHSGGGTNTQVVIADNNTGLSCPVSLVVLETLCGASGVTCDCSADPVVGGEILSIAEPGTYNTNGYTQLYVLVDSAGNILSWNNTGQFPLLSDGSYNVYAINVDDQDQGALTAALTAGTPITGFIPDGTFMGFCYTISAPSSYVVNCVPDEPAPSPLTICEDALPQTLTGPAGYTYLWSDGSTTQDLVVTMAGTYVLTITNADGCEQELSYELITNPVPNESTTPLVVCSDAGAQTLTAPTGYTNLWFDNTTGASVQVNTTGMYTLTITDGNGCTQDLVYAVTINDNPNEQETAPIIACEDSTPVSLTAPSGYTYLWNDGSSSTTQSIDVTDSDVVGVTITDANGCTQLLVFDVTVNSNPDEPVPAPVVVCEDELPVSLDGPAGFTYLWPDSSTNQTFDATVAGTYDLTITDDSGCSQLLSYMVSVNPNPVLTDLNLLVCEDVAGGALEATVDLGALESAIGATGGTFTDANGTNVPNPASVFITGTNPFVFTYTYTDANACSATATVTYNIIQTPVNVDLSFDVCELDANGVDLTALEMQIGDTGGVWSDANGVLTDATNVNVVSGNNVFSYDVVDANGCGFTASVTYNLFAGPSVTATASCTNSNDLNEYYIEVTGISGSDVNGEYLVSDGNITILYNGSTLTFGPFAHSGTGTAAITLTAENANDPMCLSTIEVLETLCGPPTTCDCSLDPTPLTILAASEPGTFNTNGYSNYYILIDNTTATGAVVSWNNTGLFSGLNSNYPYEVIAANVDDLDMAAFVAALTGSNSTDITGMGGAFANLCYTTNTSPATFNVDCGCFVCPTLDTITSSGPVCAGETFDLNATGTLFDMAGNGNTDFDVLFGYYSGAGVTTDPYVTAPTLFNGGAAVSPTGGSAVLNGMGASLAPGTYTVVAYLIPDPTLIDAVCNPSIAIDVVVNALPAEPAPAPIIVCADATPVTLTAPAGYSYLWWDASTMQSVDVSATGSYSVDITDGNGCMQTLSYDLTVNPLPSEAAPAPIIVCADATPVTLIAPAGYSYLWWDTSTMQSVDVSATGIYSVDITDGNGCIQTLSYDLTVNPLPSEADPAPITVCADATPITLSAPAGYSYAWSDGSTLQDIDVVATGLYTVTLTDGNSCTQDLVYDVTVNDNPTEMAPMPMFACTGETIILTGPTGYTYAWDTGATTSTIQVTNTGSYTLSIMDTNGCMQDLVYAVTFTDAPTISAVATCTGSADLNEYFVEVDVMGSDTYDVTVDGITQTYTGTTLTFGPVAHSGSGLGTSTVSAVSQSNVNCNASIDVLETLCGPATTCDCSMAPNPLTLLASSQPGTFNSDAYTNVYVLTDATGLVIDWNNTGLFPGLMQLTSYDITAANVDDADLANFISAVSTASLSDLLNMTNDMVGLCYSTSSPLNFNVDCACFVCDVPVITASATCVGSTDLNEYFIDVDLTGMNVYDVEVAGVTQTYSGTTLTFGPFTHSGNGLGVQTVSATAQMDATCSSSIDVLETLCGPATSCDCTDPFIPLTILAASQPGTFNTDGYTNVYVLTDATGTVLSWNNTGLFNGLAANTSYDVSAVNVDDADLSAFYAGLSGANLTDLVGLTGAFTGLCYATSAPANFNTDCGCGFYDLALTKVVSTPGPYFAGQNVTYTIEVFNQGDFDVYNVVVADYGATGLIFNIGDNTTVPNDWNASMMHTFAGPIAPGTSATVDITYQIDPMALDGVSLVNNAEIMGAEDDLGNQITDEDSTAGDNNGLDETGTDNDIDDDSTGGVDNPNDNDDYDPAQIVISCPDVAASDPNINLCSTDAVVVDLTLYDQTVNSTPGYVITWYDGPPGTGVDLSPATLVDLTALTDDLYVEVTDAAGCSTTLQVNLIIRNVGCGGSQFPWNGQ